MIHPVGEEGEELVFVGVKHLRHGDRVYSLSLADYTSSMKVKSYIINYDIINEGHILDY